MGDLRLQSDGSCCELRRHFLHMYDNSIQFDVVLLCDDTKGHHDKRVIKTHRALLSAYCKYFRDLFEMEFFNKTDPTVISPTPVVIVMKDYDYTVLKRIFDFLYRGDCCVPHDQVNDVRKYAQELGIKLVLDCLVKSTAGDYCHNKILSQTTSSNAQHHTTNSQQLPPPPPPQGLSPQTPQSSSTHPQHGTQVPQSSQISNGLGVNDSRGSLQNTQVLHNPTLRSDNCLVEKKIGPNNEFTVTQSPVMEPLVQLVTPCDTIPRNEYSSCSEPESSRYHDGEPSAGSSTVDKDQEDEAIQMFLRSFNRVEEKKMNPKNINKRTCPVCHKIFTRVDTMRSHFRGMHLQQKFSCVHCHITFKWKSHLRRHYKLYHSEEMDSGHHEQHQDHHPDHHDHNHHHSTNNRHTIVLSLPA